MPVHSKRGIFLGCYDYYTSKQEFKLHVTYVL